MTKKKSSDKNGFVFSTDPNFRFQNDEAGAQETLPPKEQKLRVRLETKHRGGKTVTLITGFIGTDADLQTLGRSLKSACGTGGSAKDGEIIIQGDHRETVMPWLLKAGYAGTKKV